MQQNQSSKRLISSASPQARFALVLLAFMIISLLPHYEEIAEAQGKVSPSLIMHGALYLGWYVLFAVQTALIGAGNHTVHKRLGRLSLGLMVLLLASGVHMLINVMQSYQANWTAEFLFSRASFVWAISHTLICFGLFYGLALYYRTRPPIHKRFMLLASLSMISASVTRVAYLPFIPIDGTALTLLVTYGFLLTPIIMDRVIDKKVHPVLKWGVPLYILTQILAIAVMPGTHVGQAIAFPF